MKPIDRRTTDEIFERYTKNDIILDKARFWQAVNKLRIETLSKVDENEIERQVRQIINTSRSMENLFDKIVEYIKELIEVDK